MGPGCLLAEFVILNDSSRKDMSVIVIYSQDDVENLQTCENKWSMYYYFAWYFFLLKVLENLLWTYHKVYHIVTKCVHLIYFSKIQKSELPSYPCKMEMKRIEISKIFGREEDWMERKLYWKTTVFMFLSLSEAALIFVYENKAHTKTA